MGRFTRTATTRGAIRKREGPKRRSRSDCICDSRGCVFGCTRFDGTYYGLSVHPASVCILMSLYTYSICLLFVHVLDPMVMGFDSLLNLAALFESSRVLQKK